MPSHIFRSFENSIRNNNTLSVSLNQFVIPSIQTSSQNVLQHYLLAKSVPMAGLSPVPRDQCSTPQLDLHVMYSTFRAQPPSTSAGMK